MAERAAPDVGLGQLLHPDGRHDSRIETLALQDVLERKRVDHGPEHAHVVCRDAIHAVLRQLRATDDVATADYEADADTHVSDFLDVIGKPVHSFEIENQSL